MPGIPERIEHPPATGLAVRKAAALLSLGLAGCGGPPEDPGWSELDSAGIRIVTNTLPAWEQGAAWEVDGRPEMVIGSPPGPDDAPGQDVVGLTRLDDGRIAIADGARGEIRYHAPDGALLEIIAVADAGLATLAGAAAFGGDTLVATDRSDPVRLGFFTPAGPTGPPVPVVLDSATRASAETFVPLGGSAGGNLLLTPQGLAPGTTAGSGKVTATASIVEVRRSGEAVGPVGEPMRLEVLGGDRPVPFPFGSRSSAAVRGDRLAVGAGGTWEYRLLDLEGSTLAIVRRADPPARITGPVWRDEVARLQAAESEGSGMGDEPSVDYGSAPMPERYPAFSAIRLDPSGRAWLQVFGRAGGLGASDWAVFDAGGRWLGEVRLNTGLKVFEVGEDYILGVVTDPLGAQRVQLFELERPRGQE